MDGIWDINLWGVLKDLPFLYVLCFKNFLHAATTSEFFIPNELSMSSWNFNRRQFATIHHTQCWPNSWSVIPPFVLPLHNLVYARVLTAIGNDVNQVAMALILPLQLRRNKLNQFFHCVVHWRKIQFMSRVIRLQLYSIRQRSPNPKAWIDAVQHLWLDNWPWFKLASFLS